MTSQGFYDGYTPSPKPIGRPPINRHLATASNVNSSIASRYASPQPDSYIVTLKIPRLRQFWSILDRHRTANHASCKVICN